MPLPAGVETVTVSTSEPLALPDGALIQGSLLFTAPDLVTIGEDDALIGGTAEAPLVDGEFTKTLVATDATGMNPSGWTYKVTSRFTNAPNWVRYISLPKATPSVVLADVLVPDPVAGEYAALVDPDSLDIPSPSTTVAGQTAYGQSAAAGTSTAYSRGDHTHGTPAVPRLDQVGAPTADVAMNNRKLTGLANGTAPTDAATVGQIPTRASLGLVDPIPADYGLTTWVYPPWASSSSGAGNSGFIYYMRVRLPVAATITNAELYQTSAGSSLTAGLVGLYTQAGSRVAVTADQASAWASGSQTEKVIPFTAPYSAAAGYYWMALLFTGTTGPSWAKGPPSGTLNAGWHTAPFPALISASGQTALPASVDLTSLSLAVSAFWAALS